MNNIIEKSSFLNQSNEVKSIVSPLEKFLDIHTFSFKRTFSDNSKIYLTNNIDYLDGYFEKDFFMIGEKEGSLENYHSCHELWKNLSDPHGLYKYVADNFDVTNGLTITRWNKEYCDFFVFAASKTNVEINRLYSERSDIFYNFCDYFLRAADTLINDTTKKRVYWPVSIPLNVDNIPTTFNLSGLMQEICKDNGLWKQLSPKELECVLSLMQGKSNKMIGRDLSISPRTVEDHLKNIRKKLGCHNRMELIALLCKMPR